ncbi:hypothetical protein U8607_24100 [Methylobacterium durans]|uniref:hypothetical protein n=1 Tax=Methylobacterium durans TaxID=2202825 RepID=UPI002AFE916D|nr:hypothetical protein [Methylobacterium durans]MEA1835173.1 hypothetical protein [Methylobacterium durans]
MGGENQAPEIIHSDAVITRGGVNRVETHGELIKIKAAVWIVGTTLVIGVITLVISTLYAKPELQTWATSVISAVSGAAIGYGFNNAKGS